MRYILFALLGASISAAPGKSPGFNALRVCMNMLRENPAALQKLRTVARVFQNVMNYETKATGGEAVLLYGGKICVDFTKPSAPELCDFLRQEKTQDWIKEIHFRGGNIEVVKEIVALYNDSLSVLSFHGYDFQNENVVLPKTLKSLSVVQCHNIPNSFYDQISVGSKKDLEEAFDNLNIHGYQGHLKGCTGLKKLNVSGSIFTGKDVVFPASLEVLGISECQSMEPAFWDQLQHLSKLKTLFVEGTSFPGDRVLPGVKIDR